jgi:trehalose/maltose transport system permease protein
MIGLFIGLMQILLQFVIFVGGTLLVLSPFYYAVLASTERGDDQTFGSILWRIAFWGIVVLICVIAVFPFYYAIMTSFESGTAIFSPNLLPEMFSLDNYKSVFSGRNFIRSVGNSVLIAGTTVIAALFLAVTASYALARVRFRGRGLLLMTILAVSMFPQIAVLSGLYELVKLFGIYNTPFALMLSYTIFTLPFTVWVLTTFMRDLPIEIEEAAIVDGATPWIIITKVFMPLLWPALVTTGLLAFIGAWNEFLFALTFTVSETQRTVPVAIALLSGASVQEIPWGPIMAASVIVTVPLIVLVLIFQRKIVAGLTAGGVKG